MNIKFAKIIYIVVIVENISDLSVLNNATALQEHENERKVSQMKPLNASLSVIEKYSRTYLRTHVYTYIRNENTYHHIVYLGVV